MIALKRRTLPLLAALALACAWSPGIRAQGGNGLNLQCGGITIDESGQMRAQSGHALQLLFADMNGAWLTDVATRIEDASGKVLAEASCGPVGLVDVTTPGRYRVVGVSAGVERETWVDLKPGGNARAVLRWLE